MKLTTLKFALGLALVFVATAAPAFAQAPAVPEIGIGNLASAATLLKTVNSSWYGLANKARSVQQAIAYLGLERTSLLLAGLLLRNVFPSSQRRAMAKFWEASTELAVTLGFIARVLGREDRDELHTFGLFRDAGSAVLIGRFDDYDAFAMPANPNFGPSLTELEQARFIRITPV